MECELVTVVDHVGVIILTAMCLYGFYKFIMDQI